jgi:hypothetical protein
MLVKSYLRGFDPRAFEKPGEGDGGATPPDPGVNPGQGGEDPPPGSGGPGGEDPPPAKPSSILDFATKGEDPNAPRGKFEVPDGLEIPDHLVGDDATTTLSKVLKAYQGARAELSKGGQKPSEAIGEIPKDPAGYEITSEDPEDPVFKDMTSEESKPIMDAWRKAAKEAGLGTKQFDAFMKMGYQNMIEGGLKVETDPEKAAQINGEAEMQSLVQEVGKAEADQILRQLDTFAVGLAKRGVLSSEDDVQEFGQMVGTARAARIMQRIIVGEFGEKAIPSNTDGPAGTPTVEEAYAAKDAALRMPPGSDRDLAVQRAEEMIGKALQEGGQTGTIRSRVL